jgi:hypothetical protein
MPNRIARQHRRNTVEVVRRRSGLRREALRIHFGISTYGIHEGQIDETLKSEEALRGSTIRDQSSWLKKKRAKAMRHQLDVVVLNPACILGPMEVTAWSRLIELIYRGKFPVCAIRRAFVLPLA